MHAAETSRKGRPIQRHGRPPINSIPFDGLCPEGNHLHREIDLRLQAENLCFSTRSQASFPKR